DRLMQAQPQLVSDEPKVNGLNGHAHVVDLAEALADAPVISLAAPALVKEEKREQVPPMAVALRLAVNPRTAAAEKRTIDSQPLSTAWARRLQLAQPIARVVFLSPGAFMRRKVEIPAPNPDWETTPIALIEPLTPALTLRTGFLESQLRRTERIGFCPP
ncbi:MAG: hypothetical protein ACRD96_16865, partial [Bryobacteraceae bacterium]